MIPPESPYCPPTIAAVPDGVHRPHWSVMIPTFNCAAYLRQTLESVLIQDPGPEHMHIEVIDDCSTKDDPEQVVNEVGRGRVHFHRKARNEGAIPNFNTCLERSRGHLVHILHGDDFVGDGFYRKVEGALEEQPTAGCAIVRSFVVDVDGQIEYLCPRLATSIEVRHSFPEQRSRNAICTPGIVARRSAYETCGGFIPELVHVADWEMTDRLTHFAGSVFVNEPLAFYRLFPGNDTGRLTRSGENLRDCLRLGKIFADRHRDFDRAQHEASLCERAWEQYWRFYQSGDASAAHANFLLWRELFRRTAPLHRRIRRFINIAWNRHDWKLRKALAQENQSAVPLAAI